jgi:uncharacterized protein YecE (DUF72 family)
MGWSYSFWKNNFYSPHSKPENFLEEYSEHFNTVEVNSSFYRVPSISTLENWSNQTAKNFCFALKVPKKITHKNKKLDSDHLEYFLDTVSHLGSKLGPLLFQFPSSFKLARHNFLEDLVSLLPKNNRYAFEVRNSSWLNERFYDFLSENNISLVLGDSQWLKKTKKITSDFVYFRWEGDRKQINGTKGIMEKERSDDLKIWSQKIISLPDQIEVFGYFSKYYSGHPPTDVKKLITHLKNN